ncbi:MAG: hypothetical protein AAGA57_02825, partial [Planctomycetota bacterium]
QPSARELHDLQQRIADLADPALLTRLDNALAPATARSDLASDTTALASPEWIRGLDRALGPAASPAPDGLADRVFAAVQDQLVDIQQPERDAPAVLARIGPEVRRWSAVAAVLLFALTALWWGVDRVSTPPGEDASPERVDAPQPDLLDSLLVQAGEELAGIADAISWAEQQAVGLPTITDPAAGASPDTPVEPAVEAVAWDDPFGDDAEALWLELDSLRQAAGATF